MKVEVSMSMEEYQKLLKYKALSEILTTAMENQTKVLNNVEGGIEDTINLHPLGKKNKSRHEEGEIGYDLQGWLNHISDNGYQSGYADIQARKLGLFDMDMLPLVDSPVYVDNSQVCGEGCSSVSFMNYNEAKIDASGTGVQVRHYGECTHGVAIYDKVHTYEHKESEYR